MPVITKISLQKRTNDRYNVFLDGKYEFPVSEEVLVHHKLKKGLKLTDETIREIVQDENFEKIYNKVLNFLSYRERSRKEVKDRLSEYLYKSGVAKKLSTEFEEKIMNKVDGIGLLDDSKFVKTVIQDTKESRIPKGRRKIQQFLFQRGVDRELISEHLSAYSFDDELKGALVEIEKKIRLLKGKKDYKARQKMWQFLARKGYSPDVVNAAVDSKFEV